MADALNKWVRHLRNFDRLAAKEREEYFAARQRRHCSECGSQLEYRDPGCFYCFWGVSPPPIDNPPALVSEVKTGYAPLVKAEETCTQLGQGQSRNSERNPDLNLEQCEILQAIHRTLSQKHHEHPIAFSPICPGLSHLRKIAYDPNLKWRSFRQFSLDQSRLLWREKNLDSERQCLELMTFSLSLSDILGQNELLFLDEEMVLMDTSEEKELIFGKQRRRSSIIWLWIRLWDPSDEKERLGLSDLFFEFPNNFRHTCTTMPWTILPALLVLWGVCWMFIIGFRQPEYELGNAADSIISPVPATHDLNADSYCIEIEEGPQGSVADGSDNRLYLNQDTWEELFLGDGQSMNDLIYTLTFDQNTPQDSNFLIPDMTSGGDSGNLKLAWQDAAEILPSGAMEDSTFRACINPADSGEMDDTGSADSSDDVHRTINSVETEETKSRIVCPDCRQTFARPFTLRRHQTEKHEHASILGKPLLCPNRGCKRSKGEPFKRESHLKRHLGKCKHSQGDLGQGDDQPCPRPASTSTSASASIHHRQEVRPDKAIRANGMKRPRAEDDKESNDKFLLTEMVKKYKKLEKEIKEKQDDLKVLGKTIQMLERS
ncbi:hypothetical protein F25303_9418 [Fusarium sp. NRRL 25303]|nr:hypothetical protein F25303_9418 [Fusarium sp. NRRL 25303]